MSINVPLRPGNLHFILGRLVLAKHFHLLLEGHLLDIYCLSLVQLLLRQSSRPHISAIKCLIIIQIPSVLIDSNLPVHLLRPNHTGCLCHSHVPILFVHPSGRFRGLWCVQHCCGFINEFLKYNTKPIKLTVESNLSPPITYIWILSHHLLATSHAVSTLYHCRRLLNRHRNPSIVVILLVVE